MPHFVCRRWYFPGASSPAVVVAGLVIPGGLVALRVLGLVWGFFNCASWYHFEEDLFFQKWPLLILKV